MEVFHKGVSETQMERFVQSYLSQIGRRTDQDKPIDPDVQQGELFLRFVAQNQLLKEVVKIPVYLKILLALWRRKSEHMRSADGASIVALFRLLTSYLVDRYRQDH